MLAQGGGCIVQLISLKSFLCSRITQNKRPRHILFNSKEVIDFGVNYEGQMKAKELVEIQSW